MKEIEIKVGEVKENKTQEFEVFDKTFRISTIFTICIDNIEKLEEDKDAVLKHIIYNAIQPYKEALQKYIAE